MFARDVTRSLQIGEGEGAFTAVIRKLSWKALRKAQSIAAREGLVQFAGIDVDTLDALRSRAPNRDARYQGYDIDTVLLNGIVSWSSAAQITSENISDLDAEVGEPLYRGILDLSLPPVDPEAAKAAEKKAEGASPAAE